MMSVIRYSWRQQCLSTTSLTVMLLALAHSHALANPADGVVRTGVAQISTSANRVDVYQQSDKSIIDWRNFDIAAGEVTEFHQPSSQAVALNRVVSQDPTHILGTLKANGRVAIVNQNGVIFDESARVDVGGLAVSTADVDNDAFMSSDAVAFNKAGNPGAAIINRGKITAQQAGLVTLVAPQVKNEGIISAELGKVQLAAGEISTLDLAGDGLIKIAVLPSDIQSLQLEVHNSGSLEADGGRVLLMAADARGLVDSLITNAKSGIIQADTVGVKRGAVDIQAQFSTAETSHRATIENSGVIKAVGLDHGERGGDVTISAQQIGILAGASVSVKGKTGGGNIRLGGNYQGLGSMPHAKAVYVDSLATIESSAESNGNGGRVILWSDDVTRFYGRIISNGGSENGDGGFVEVSSKGWLDFDGFVSTYAAHGAKGELLLDPTDITISSAASNNVTFGAQYEPSADDVSSNINATVLEGLLATSSVIVATRATGSQSGNLTVSAPLSWASGSSLTLDAHNNLVINSPVTGDSLTLQAGNDIAINADLNTSSFGPLTIQPRLSSISMGVGTGQVGTINISDSELAHIKSGWANTIYIGRSDMTAPLNIGAYAWAAGAGPIRYHTDTGVISINGALSFANNNASILTNADPVISANLSGTAVLNIRGTSSTTSIGLAGGAGTLNLSATELAKIVDGWSSIQLGANPMTGTINVGAFTWSDPVTFLTSTGVITVSGAQNMGNNNLTLWTNANPVIGGNLAGTAALTFRGLTGSTTIGVAGGAGTLNLSAAELAYITDGWSNISFGSTTTTGAINVSAATWNDSVTFRSATGVVNINGAQNMGGNSLSFEVASNPVIAANLVGTGTLTFQGSAANTSIGLAGGAGTLNLSTAELAFLLNGWSDIVFGSTIGTGAINVNAATWNDNVTFRSSSGSMTISGTQNVGTSNLTFESNGNPNILGNLTGTGVLRFKTVNNSTVIGVANAIASPFDLSSAELSRITNGWSKIHIGSSTMATTLLVGSTSWNDNVVLETDTGIINIAGPQTMGGNSLAMITSANPTISANISGTGTFSLAASTTPQTIAVGSAATGTIKLDDTELGYLQNGFSTLNFGYHSSHGTMPTALAVSAYNWNDPVNFYTTGVLAVQGTQNAGSNNMGLLGNAIDISASVNGTGTLTLRPVSDIAINLADGASASGYSLSTAELDNIGSSWDTISIGYHSWANPVDLRAYSWRSNVAFNLGSSVLTVNGAQNFGSKNLTVNANSDPVINATLSGSGVLTFAPNSTVTNNTSIGLAGGAGLLNLTSIELGYIENGWANLYFGSTNMTGALTLGSASWQDPVTLATGSGIIGINGTQALGSNYIDLYTGADINVMAPITTSDRITVYADSTVGTVCLACTAGTINLTNSELDYLDYGILSFEATNSSMLVGARNWNNGTEQFVTSGVMTFNGANNFGAGNVLFYSDNDIRFLSPVSGSGQLSFLPNGNTTSLSVGVAGAGLELLSSDIANIADGWSSIFFDMNTSAVTQGITFGGSNTWVDPVRIDTYSTNQPITLGGTQTFGANGLTINTDSDVAVTGSVSGSGALVIRPQSAATTMSVAGAGAVDLSTSDIAGLVNGWSSITFGSTSATSDINISTSSWADPVTFLTRGNILLNGTLSSTQTGSGTAFILASMLGNFINSGGSINPNTGRFLIYSTNPSADVTGSLLADLRRFSCTYDGSCPAFTATGNAFLYRYTPTLTVSVVDPAYTYGRAAGSYGFTYSGHLGSDAAADIISGVGAVTSTYSVTADAGTAYSLTYLSGLSSAMGYSLVAGAATSGVVTKAPLIARAVNTSRIYGANNPALAVSYTGFVLGENQSVIDTLATASTFADSLSSPGQYAITVSGALDNNYSFSYVDGQLLVQAVSLEQMSGNVGIIVSGGSDRLFRDWERQNMLSGRPAIESIADLDRYDLSYVFPYHSFNIRPELMDLFNLQHRSKQSEKRRRNLQ